MTTRYIGVHGTWAWKPENQPPDWFMPGSAFDQEMQRAGFVQALEEPFIWTGDIDGTLVNRGNDWEAAAVWLARVLRPLPYFHRNLVLHSHGGAVGVLAALQVPVRSLITIGTPARREVRDAGRAALRAGNILTWVHVSDDRFDLWGQLGAFFDGHWRVTRTMDLDGCRDVRLQGIGHSKMLDGAHGHLWEQHGLYAALRDAMGV